MLEDRDRVLGYPPYVDMPGRLQEKVSEMGDFEECG